jgi:hypothetical protein
MHQSNPDHPIHDLTLVAAHAAGDLLESERADAEALLASCADCADLHRDLLAIASATRTVPAPLARTRDFQLGPEHAERLRRGSWLRAALRPFGSPRSALRPVAAAFTTLGVAGLLVAATLPGIAGGAAMSAPQRDATSGAGAPAATSASGVEPGAPVPQAGTPSQAPAEYEANGYRSAAPKASDSSVKAVPGQSAGAVAIDGATGGSGNGEPGAPGALLQSSPPNLLVVASLGLLGIGLLLFGLRFAGRRVR